MNSDTDSLFKRIFKWYSIGGLLPQLSRNISNIKFSRWETNSENIIGPRSNFLSFKDRYSTFLAVQVPRYIKNFCRVLPLSLNLKFFGYNLKIMTICQSLSHNNRQINRILQYNLSTSCLTQLFLHSRQLYRRSLILDQ